ncbi:HNH endonuclease [Streptomyces murinus]|uniref:HNH endonuclease n=1 Tax=Streptomyces murinus TaxID=33900 RepID=UPI000A1FE175|nr:HNH endonuclease [Streptomyces murinus]WDO09947.1 HNH endonuclease [Streptomyces murinus]
MPQLSEQEIERRTRQARSGRPWRRLQTRVFAEESHCWICHRYVDQTLSGTTHPMGRTVDHVHPLWLGGDPLDRQNLRLAHRRCNTARNNQLRARSAPRPSFTTDAASL